MISVTLAAIYHPTAAVKRMSKYELEKQQQCLVKWEISGKTTTLAWKWRQTNNNFDNSPVRCWCMAIDRNINKKTGCGTSQMAEEHIGHLLERQDNKHWGQNQNRTTNHGQYTERKKITLAWTCSAYGPSAHTTASTVLEGTRRAIHERSYARNLA